MSEINEWDAQNARFFQAKTDTGETEGLAMSSFDEQGRLVLDSIHVNPRSRKKGVGGALWDAVVNWGRSKGAEEITGEFSPKYKGGKDEEAARSFYEKRGVEIDENKQLRGKI